MIHFDQAREGCIDSLRQLCEVENAISRAVLIDDLFGKIRLVLWFADGASEEIKDRIDHRLRESGGDFWSGEIWIAEGNSSELAVYNTAWEESREVSAKLRVADRHRSKGSWLTPASDPIWADPNPPVLSFYSFKGGVGRTTALAAFAIRRARAGERVVVLDLDFEAPGAGVLLDPGEGIPGAQWGVLDYLVERPLLGKDLPLRDYYHACARESVTGSGEILVFPAARLNDGFLPKLSRVDLEPALRAADHALVQLLRQIREELRPNWVLLDCRAGISEAAGLIVNGLAHLNVLFGTASEQSWQGLQMVLTHAGAERIQSGLPQLEILLVHAMAPEEPNTRELARADFLARSDEEFSARYYAEDPQDPDDDQYWYIRDRESEFAPHVPIVIPYMAKLSFVRGIDGVADELVGDSAYQDFFARIEARFQPSTEEEEE
jgi:hypothetical protein